MKDEEYMELALIQAQKAFEAREVPVGALVVRNGDIISQAHNMRENHKNPCAHAEILAIEEASKKLGRWRLDDCDVYVTLEPCPMCAGALLSARVRRLVIGTEDPKSGAVKSLFEIGNDDRLNHKFSEIRLKSVEITEISLKSTEIYRNQIT